MEGFQDRPAAPELEMVAINTEPLSPAPEVPPLPQDPALQVATNNEAPPPPSPPPLQQEAEQHIEWAVTICLGFASQPIQTKTPSSKTYAEVGLTLVMLAFACLFLAKSGCFGRKTSRLMQHFGVFFSFSAFFVRTTSQSSVWLKCVGGAVYSLTWLAIFVFNVINNPVPIPHLDTEKMVIQKRL